MLNKGGCQRIRFNGKAGRKQIVAISLIFACSISVNALAQFEFGVTEHIEYIENPDRLSGPNDDEELLSQLSINAGYEQVTRMFASSLNYQARKLEYKNDLLDDRDLISGDGSIVWIALPDILSWNLSNSRTFQVQDTSLPDTSDNRQIVNTSSTGPLISMRMGAANKMDVQLNYSLADFERISTYSQTRKSANISLLHLFSPKLTGGINFNILDSAYDENSAFDFDRKSLSLTSAYSNVNYDLNVEVGRNEINRQFQDSRNSLLLKLGGSYKINNSSRLTAAYSRSDEDLLSNLDIAPQESDGVFQNSVANSNQTQVYQLKRTSISYSYTIPASFSASIDYTNLSREYDIALENQENKNISVQATWPLSPKLNMTVFGRRTDLTFAENNRTQNRNELGFRGNYNISQKFSLRFSVLQTTQDANILLDNYDGMNSFVAISYRH